jgi:flagellar hook-associated protein 1 FlgK
MSFLMLNIATRSLAAQQLAMDVTAQNLSNSTTPGYNRQIVNLTPGPEQPMGGYNAANGPSQLGDGVYVSGVTQATDAFLARSVTAQTGLAGTWSATSQALQQLQSLFQEPSSTGLGEAMDAFFGAWQTLSQNPSNVSAEQGVLGQAQQLTSAFQNISNQLTSLQGNLNQTVISEVGQINSLAQQIANVNQSIAQVGIQSNPNQLLDQQNQLMSQLSQLVNVTYSTSPAGQLDVYIGAHALVLGPQTASLTTVQDPTSGMADVQWSDGSTANIQSGELYGSLQVRGQTVNGTVTGYIPTYLSQLNSLAAGLASAVNQLQSSGYAPNGTAPTGIPFFTAGSSGSITAGSIQLNPALASNPQLLASASTAGSPGDGSNALAIADLAQNNTITYPGQSGSGTFSSFWGSLVGQVGLDGQGALNRQQTTQSTLANLQNQLQSVVGVNPDEESVHLIQEEQSYRAAVQVITSEQANMSALLAAIG